MFYSVIFVCCKICISLVFYCHSRQQTPNNGSKWEQTSDWMYLSRDTKALVFSCVFGKCPKCVLKKNKLDLIQILIQKIWRDQNAENFQRIQILIFKKYKGNICIPVTPLNEAGFGARLATLKIGAEIRLRIYRSMYLLDNSS